MWPQRIPSCRASFLYTRFSFQASHLSHHRKRYHFNLRVQRPIRLCCSMTINKAPGQSLKIAILQMDNDVISMANSILVAPWVLPGDRCQGYDRQIMSSYGRPYTLMIRNPATICTLVKDHTDNFVYPEAIFIITPLKILLFCVSECLHHNSFFLPE